MERPVSHRHGTVSLYRDGAACQSYARRHSSEMERPVSHILGMVSLFKNGAACQAWRRVTLQRCSGLSRWSSLPVTGMALYYSSEIECPASHHRQGTVSLFRDVVACQSQARDSVTLWGWNDLSVHDRHCVTLQRRSGLSVTGMALCDSSEMERPVSHMRGTVSLFRDGVACQSHDRHCVTLQRRSGLSVTGTALCDSSEMEQPVSHMRGTVSLFRGGAACQSLAWHSVTLQRWSDLSVTGMALCHSSEMQRPVSHRHRTV
ncbi:hypothetical protein NDU88_007115 [Pleurodeles waltl]|uniref:Uncharacterized protein n=1 Tax=Pleurodeles waltl TaxID=8319 RepID=A0AAV7MET9_PLEWA|nr:hypothetical protein NDU88_007115 [Pleurodeles waltl]